MPDPVRPEPGGGGTPRRLGHRGLRSSLSQAGTVAALLAVFTLCAAVGGLAGLLVTTGQDRALSSAVVLADGDEVDGGADLTTVFVNAASGRDAVPPDAASLLPLVRRTLLEAAHPYQARVSLWTTTPLWFLGGDAVRRGYLLEADTVTSHAVLGTGSWPTTPDAPGAVPVAIPAATAEALGAGVGTELLLAPQRGVETAGTYRLVVAGTFVPSGSPVWDRDLLRGAGYDPDYQRLPTYGPFVVAPGALAELVAPVDRVVAVMDPDLAGDAAGVPGLLQRLGLVETRLQDAAGPAVGSVRAWSGLGAAFDRLNAELGVTSSLVLSVLLLILALGAAAAAPLAGALAERRGGELALLRDRGASGSQLVLGATAEALVVAILAAAVAVPLVAAGFGLGAPAAPGATQGLSPGREAWFGLIAGAAVPALVLVAVAFRQRPRGLRRGLPGGSLRSGIDLMAALVAVVAYLQLRRHAPVPGVLSPLAVAAPAACVLAVAALTTRLLPLAGRLAEGAARRGRSFVGPMAAWQVARGGATRGTLLVVLAAAIGTLAVTSVGTWQLSQADQAAALAGADLAVGVPGGPDTRRGLEAIAGGAVTPVSDRAVVLGTRPDGVTVLAVDAKVAGQVVAGRPPAGEDWQGVMAPLAPAAEGAPLVVPGDPTELVVTGSLQRPPAGLPLPVLTATPTLVLADDAGATELLVGSPVVLDGTPHPVRLSSADASGAPTGRRQVIAIDLRLTDETSSAAGSADDLMAWGNTAATVQVEVTVVGAGSPAGTWDAAVGDGRPIVRPREAAVQGDTVRASFSYTVIELVWQDAHLTLLSFPAGTEVPVALDEGLAAELGAAPGDRIALTWGTTALTAAVGRTVPYVPGHAEGAALLADLTSLQRALLSAGLLEPVAHAWWVADPGPGAAPALREAGFNPVVDREETVAALRDGPLRAAVPLAWLLAVAAAVGLAVAGSAARAAAEADRRAGTMARVRALGLSRRDALASQLIQHAAVTTAGVVLGGACGILLATLLVPLLVTSPTGHPAVPDVTLVWSGGWIAAVLAAILVGGVLAGLPSALAIARRSTVAALRAGEAP